MKKSQPDKLLNTYSIVARDPQTGELGVGVQTHQMGVGWMVPWLIPGVGAIATQSLVNISFGPIGLEMLREGISAQKVVDGLIGSDDRPDVRQLAAVDPNGHAAAWTGSGCIPEAAHFTGDGYSVQANMMERKSVIPAMRAAFEGSSGRLADRILAALGAAELEGGDIRGMQSAALKIVEGDRIKALELKEWESIYDIRVDEHPEPIAELRRLVRLRTSQLLTDEGEIVMDNGDIAGGLLLWDEARGLAPELEELGFWQAIVLADNHGDIQGAADIFGEAFRNDPRRDHWLELIKRLDQCGFLDEKGVADALLEMINEQDL